MNIFFFIPIFIQSSLIHKSSEELTALHEPRISTGSNYLSSLFWRIFSFRQKRFPSEIIRYRLGYLGTEAESQSESEKAPTSMIRSEKTFSGVADMPQSRFPFIVSMEMRFVFRFPP